MHRPRAPDERGEAGAIDQLPEPLDIPPWRVHTSAAMCRLFGLHGGDRRVRACFWLLEAPQSLALQSRSQPDGYGIGTFEEDGSPEVERGVMAAWQDRMFAQQARTECSRTYVVHLRYASTGPTAMRNTHPFLQDGRLLAHNGVIDGLADLEAHLREDRALVHGDTDSERLFALITRETRRAGGDLHEGIAAAVRWIGEHLPLYSLNFVLATADELWALRYWDTNELWVLERRSGGPHGCRHLDEASETGTLRVRSNDLATCDAVVLASERMDENPDWRLLEPGELLHVAGDLRCASTVPIAAEPADQLTVEDLDQRAAASQTAEWTPAPAGPTG
jgi:predicted glutamine amidotransferase